MAEKAFEQAVNDILSECERTGRCFMAFRSKLNPVMDELVNEYIEEQSRL